MYSVSKTFVSAAIGMLADEGKISLNDKIVKYFPDKLPNGELQPYIADTTIRDLLVMATPYSNVTYGLEFNDWAWTFFNTPTTHPSGTIFSYDTSGTYILDVIVERVTGMPFLQYMRKGLFDHIGFSKDTWCIKAPEGCSWGGSGVMGTTRDLAKFALVFLNGGKFNGNNLSQRIISRRQITKQIDNNTEGMNYLGAMAMDTKYGYWMMVLLPPEWVHNWQFAILKDFLFVCTGDTQGNTQAERMIFETLWHEIIEKLSDELPADTKAYNSLIERCSTLSLIPIQGEDKAKY